MNENNVTEAVRSLCGIMRERSSDDCYVKAEAICRFATQASRAVLERAGVDFRKDPKRWSQNQLADAEPRDCDTPYDSDFLATLFLNKVPSTLDRKIDRCLPQDPAKLSEHIFLFKRDGRVHEMDLKTDKTRRVLTYEETARFVVFWFAERIIQITRKNEWDRVRELPDLFDRLASLISA
jgi:hypothetical protein